MNYLQKLSDTEIELMEEIWGYEQPVTSRELLNTFSTKGREWKSQTISTFLSRLVEKGFLHVTRRGRINTYVPCISSADYKLQETQNVLDGLYEGSVKNLISALYDGEKLSSEDIAELKQWFSER
ncbi:MULTISPECIES: BlaI/MecI/CopY family transcriptional regulator [unclassified Sporosarcina]|uniref:BlaI/MecI/CopY family transcriptional regulator n=1 Tax=unclassified Sporosarcina TaxID=2647733 RepID=UPI00203C726D|nr:MULTISPECIES: BlaI/MecI/CopY family transcriptional regulator [unclassified Sporosarcina]GKV63912.1 transcriptional regulator [Sporosarcina sp. NCCP-2331]GLB54692.1 transcriptional regulator [Sporosarcina sp. NCCP-2378]